ncbi:hypothetical protein [Schlesneria paludicola]|uniref:hypothetical protein n=1 Tax=Schlesneria paludicola TaxID=360056 RepID=UPI000299CE8D|nr:hypothetical protein [Schlesneria paludicola]
MGDFFKPLQRKMGVLTLVLACVLTAGWVRSPHIGDKIEFPLGSGEFVVARSTPDGINLSGRRPLFDARLVQVLATGLPCTLLSNWMTIPYWSIVLPLTVLSAYLLLSKPRMTRSVPNQGLQP